MNTFEPKTIDPAKHSGMVLVAYILIGLGYFTALSTGLIGLILTYVKRSDVRGTYLESHCNRLISVFWWSAIWFVIGMALCFTVVGVVIGGPILVISYIWTGVKLLRGFLKLHAEEGLDA